jgi:hypothetical protein
MKKSTHRLDPVAACSRAGDSNFYYLNEGDNEMSSKKRTSRLTLPRMRSVLTEESRVVVEGPVATSTRRSRTYDTPSHMESNDEFSG